METLENQMLVGAFRYGWDDLSELEKLVLWVIASRPDNTSTISDGFYEIDASDVTSIITQPLEITNADVEAAVSQLYNRLVVIGKVKAPTERACRWLQSMAPPSAELHPVAMRFSKEALPYMAWLRQYARAREGRPQVVSKI